MMSWKITHMYLHPEIKESADILDLKQFIADNNIICDVLIEHCHWDFWLTREEQQKLHAAGITFGLKGKCATDRSIVIRISIVDNKSPRPNLTVTTNIRNENILKYESTSQQYNDNI